MSHFEHDELDSFFAEMQDVKPIISDDKAQLHDPEAALAEKQKRASLQASIRDKLKNPLSMEGVKPVPPDDFIQFQQPGIQDGVFKKLRLGKYPLEVVISMAGKTLDESRNLLYQNVISGHEKGVRALLIKHGTGENSKPFPALKKSYVNHWLRELEEVIAFHTAQPMHGGFGATYVLLKKHPQQKLINREKNRKG
ncbi:DNA endonuclease SmrA [Alteromonas sp.]|jgi:DNA-nicking Smr family endonuclease|uniref:DNA endonuclease SmrA n=1 Tax=Alteromonas sp. TaxID=232 RepID=UPI000B6AF546|nr:DNA endonuclease SmrA [Alteromonas sp.]MAI38525.1 DNA endonuclease SmrA [Alteromonas sp.]OUX85801.1 MAG: DNA endonuclease SmrA [Alteromonas sp. TMED35]|tara:strand:- start:99534 stop:100121 length:588 start_codon:yes stop_codon:yes gene_type:complete